MTAPTLDTRPFDGVTIPTAGTFALDPAHTEVAAIARHLVVSKVRGTFGGTTGTIVIADDPLQSSVTASIPAATINTNSTDRDNHLRSADFLDVENHPTLDFRSTSIVSHKGAEFVATLPVKRFHGVGPVTAAKMERLGILTGADLARWWAAL